MSKRGLQCPTWIECPQLVPVLLFFLFLHICSFHALLSYVCAIVDVAAPPTACMPSECMSAETAFVMPSSSISSVPQILHARTHSHARPCRHVQHNVHIDGSVGDLSLTTCLTAPLLLNTLDTHAISQQSSHKPLAHGVLSTGGQVHAASAHMQRHSRLNCSSCLECGCCQQEPSQLGWGWWGCFLLRTLDVTSSCMWLRVAVVIALAVDVVFIVLVSYMSCVLPALL